MAAVIGIGLSLGSGGVAVAAPVDLSATGQNALQPQVAIDVSGNATAVWIRSNGTHTIVQAASRPASGAWSTPDDLSTAGQNASTPQVAVDASGNATAVWSRSNGTHTIVQAASRPAGGAWSTPDDLSATGQNASTPQVAIDASGNATAVWIRSNGTHTIVQAASRPAGGAWSTPDDLSAIGQNATVPQVAVDASGNATAVWSRSNGTHTIVQAASRPAGGAWSTPDDLSATGQNAFFPQVAVNASGAATAVWHRANGTNFIVQAASRPAGGAWSTPDDLSAPGQNGIAAQVAVSTSGVATAVWYRFNGVTSIVQAASRPAGDVWSTPEDLSATGRTANSPQVAVDSSGNVTAVWLRSNGSHNIVQAASRLAGGAWSTPVDLSAAGQHASAPQVAVDSSGNATAVWYRPNGTNDIVQADRYQLGNVAPAAPPETPATPSDQTTPSGPATSGEPASPAGDETPVVLAINDASVRRRCVRSARLRGSPVTGSGGLAFDYTLTADATVRYVIRHRVGSQAWSFCPRTGGNVAASYKTVSDTKRDEKAGQHTTSVATTASTRRIARRLKTRAGRTHIPFARIAGTATLKPGSYSLHMTATGTDGQVTDITTIRFWVLANS